MNGLAPHTSELFEKISLLECIKPFVLVGGTALSLQLNLRQSEDLDFMRWKQSPKDKLEVGISTIKHELETVGHIDAMDIGDFNFVEFVVEGVKLSFYAAPRKQITSMQVMRYLNNLQLADIKSIGAMKMEAMLRRSKFRDYYDIYTILKHGVDFNEMIELALEHSGHLLKRKNLLAMLTNGERFRKDKAFLSLNPVYEVSAYDIQEYIKAMLLEMKA
ncbi:MAG: nucleotidyl transferase AbiEii/AbiGii toxin family protein [Prevotella sp.]|nr:nucleotidyl transferase AbiEii/AbiGii toxin family protein [Prevotella sp.]